MNISTLNVSEVKPYHKNAKKHPKKQVDQVAASIKEFGFNQPIVVDADNVVIVGHGRLEAAKQLGLEEVPVLTVDLTEEQAKAYRLADNKLNESDWDMDLVIEELKGLEPAMIDLTGFDVDLVIDKDIEEDEVPDVPEEPKAKLGEVYQLGEHRLMCGDATKIEDVEKLMDGEKADMVFTDPPYGIGIDGQKKSKSKNPKHDRKAHEFRGWDDERPSEELFNLILSMGLPTIIFGGNYFADLLPSSRGWIYWSKGQDGLTMSDGELAWTNQEKPLRAVTVNRAELQGSVHPTQKPLSVVTFCLDYIEDAIKVLDLFGGSGSTLMACEQTNRKCYMMELDPRYIDVIIKRWEDFTGETAVKIEQ